MARARFGGGVADFVFNASPGGNVKLSAATLTMWSAETGGTRYTDLLRAGAPVDAIVVGSDGQVPTFDGPDGIYEMWADAGASRVLLGATADSVQDAAARAEAAATAAQAVGTTTDTVIAGRITTPGSATATALAASIAGTAVPRWKAFTAYTAGDTVLAPDGSLVKANTTFTSGTTYSAANWTSVATAAGTQAAAELAASFPATDGVPTVRHRGSGKAGIFDWEFGGDGAPGYLFHLRASASSRSDEYAIGIGTDAGHGGAVLISHKNDGTGVELAQQPGAGVGVQIENRSASAAFWINQYVSGGGMVVALKSGQGFADGTTTAGSATLTSATANFQPADVGRTITVHPPNQNAIPASATILSRQSSTSVTLSVNATENWTGNLKFTVGTRAQSAGDPIFRVFGTDSGSGSAMVAALYYGKMILGVPMESRTTADSPLIVQGIASQTADLFSVRKISTDTAGALIVDSTGKVGINYQVAISNISNTGAIPLYVANKGTFSTAPTVKLVNQASGNGDLIQMTASDGSTVLSRVNKAGAYMTRVTTAPADADVVTGECAWWFDSTTAAAKVMFKAKDAGGTVRTGSVALA